MISIFVKKQSYGSNKLFGFYKLKNVIIRVPHTGHMIQLQQR